MSRIGTVVSGFIKADDGMDMGSKRTPNGWGRQNKYLVLIEVSPG